MRHTTLPLLLAAALVVAGCKSANSNTDSARGATTSGSAAGAAAGDADIAQNGSGVPAGYQGRTDRESQQLTDAKYTVTGNRWEVRTGPAHIVYAPGDTARGSYTVRAHFEQLEAPGHPEAFGLFIGGQKLDQPGQQYTYFLVRGTGEYLVKVRDGANTRNVIAWTANGGIPKADASGKATYTLAATVTADSVRFSVNDEPVATVAKAGLPTDGVAGLRINHNLHVATGPVVIEKK